MKYVREYYGVEDFELDIMNMKLTKNASLESWQAVQSESGVQDYKKDINRLLHFRIIAIFEGN